MTALAIHLNRHTRELQVHGLDRQSVHNSIARYQQGSLEIFCWGDPAAVKEDALIVAELLLGRGQVHWGRSWACINHNTATLEAATDRVGVFPIIGYQDDQQTVLASSRQVMSEVVHDLSLCPDAMRELLAFGQILDDKSILQNCQHHRGNVHLTQINSHARLTNQSTEQLLLGRWHTRFDDALEAFVEAIRAVVSVQPNVMVSLSGGLDSRLILAAVKAVGGNPTAITYGDPSSADVQIARQLADACQVPLFTSNALSDQKPWEVFKRIAQLSQGESPVHHAHAIMDDNLLEQTANKILLTGTGAETYRAFYYDRGMPGYSAMQYRSLNKWLLPKAQRYITQEFLKTAQPFFNIAPEFRSQLMAALHDSIQPFLRQDLSAALAMDNFYLQGRIPRMVTAGQQLLDPYYQRSHPFLDKEVVFYAGNLPARYKIGSQFHRLAIERLSPTLANINWDKTGTPLANGLSFTRRYPALASRVGLKNAWGKQASPMFRYDEWLNLVSTDATTNMFEYIGLTTEALHRNKQWQKQVADNTHLLGLTAVWAYLLKTPTLPMKPLLSGELS